MKPAVVTLALLTLLAPCGPAAADTLGDRVQAGEPHLVRLRVDPTTGAIHNLSLSSRDIIDSSFDLVSATCTNCNTDCPPFPRTVEVVLEANTAIGGGWGVSDLVDGNYTTGEVVYSTQDPLTAGQEVTITVTGDVIDCGSWFSLWFSICDTESAPWSEPCTTCPEGPLTFTVLHTFTGNANDGGYPPGTLTRNGPDLYGMTYGGGASGMGTVFRITADGSGFQILHSFAGGAGDGARPYGGALALGGASLYGMTRWGGASSRGVVFVLGTDGSGFQTLHEFAGGVADGREPYGSVTLDGATLYGLTNWGGTADRGVAFSIATNGSGFKILHSFAGGAGDGAWPKGFLTIDGSKLYGIAAGGGASGLGVVFSMGTDGSDYEILHSFAGGPGDGEMPFGSLSLEGTTLSGMTNGGGGADLGVIFSMGTDGSGYQILHSFAGGAGDGAKPNHSTPFLCGSTQYAMTRYGGADDEGVVFSMGTGGSGFQTLYEFADGAGDGRYPSGSLILRGSALYGVAYYGGASNQGVLFKLE